MRISHTLDGYAGEIFSIAFSPDGTQLASGSRDRTVKIWSVSGGFMLSSFPSDFYLYDLAFSSTGTEIAAGGEGGNVTVWDLPTKNNEVVLAVEKTVDLDARKNETGASKKKVPSSKGLGTYDFYQEVYQLNNQSTSSLSQGDDFNVRE